MKKDLKCYKENLGLYLLRWFVNFVYNTITGINQNFKLPGVPNFCDFKKSGFVNYWMHMQLIFYNNT